MYCKNGTPQLAGQERILYSSGIQSSLHITSSNILSGGARVSKLFLLHTECPCPSTPVSNFLASLPGTYYLCTELQLPVSVLILSDHLAFWLLFFCCYFRKQDDIMNNHGLITLLKQLSTQGLSCFTEMNFENTLKSEQLFLCGTWSSILQEVRRVILILVKDYYYYCFSNYYHLMYHLSTIL